MIITQPALICLESALRRLRGRGSVSQPPVIGEFGPHPLGPSAARAVQAAGEPELARIEVALGTLTPLPALDPVKEGPGEPLTASERRARAAALRALAFSRERRFDAARIAFAVAAQLDPSLDLTRTPAFWQLERGAHEAAIAAYLEVGRDDDAAVLRARVRSTFRPKPLRPQPSAAFGH